MVAPDAASGSQQSSNDSEHRNGSTITDGSDKAAASGISYADALKEDPPAQDSAPAQDNTSHKDAKPDGHDVDGNTHDAPSATGATAGGISYAAAVKEETSAQDSAPKNDAHAQPGKSTTSTSSAGSASYAAVAKIDPPPTEDKGDRTKDEHSSTTKSDETQNGNIQEKTSKDTSEEARPGWAVLTTSKNKAVAPSVTEPKPELRGGPGFTNGHSVRRRVGASVETVKDWISGTESTSTLESSNDRNGASQLQHHHEPHRTFAPLNVPLRRRLQTLAIFIHCSCLMFAIPFFLFICSNPFTWPLMIPYLLHVIYSSAAVDGHLRYRSKYFRALPIWTWFAEYFPAQLHKTHDLPPTRKYIFGYHPHGIISHGAFVAFATEALGFSKKFPGITNTLLTLDSNFKIPLYREYVLAAGMGSVSKGSIKNLLRNGGADGMGMGRGVTIVIGGARESLEAQPGTMKLILKERLGFVKMAIQTGADLVPVIGFGETDLYDQLNKDEHPWVHKFQLFVLRAMKFTLPFMRGRGVFNYDYGLMPYRRPLNIVVGKPIKVEAAAGINGLDAEVVRHVHSQYMEELQRLWETYKDVYMPERSGEMQLLV